MVAGTIGPLKLSSVDNYAATAELAKNALYPATFSSALIVALDGSTRSSAIRTSQFMTP